MGFKFFESVILKFDQKPSPYKVSSLLDVNITLLLVKTLLELLYNVIKELMQNNRLLHKTFFESPNYLSGIFASRGTIIKIKDIKCG